MRNENSFFTRVHLPNRSFSLPPPSRKANDPFAKPKTHARARAAAQHPLISTMIKSARVQSEISRRASGAERNVVMLSGTIPSVSGCISKMKLPSSSATAWNRRPREQNANSPPARTNSFESGCNFEQPGFGRGRGERGCANRADPKGYESPKGGQSPVFWPDISSGSLRVSLPERRRGRGGDRPTGR